MAKPNVSTMRRFLFRRDTDSSDFSGNGNVVEGVQFSNGMVALRWFGDFPSVVLWQNVTQAMATHGHGGDTDLVWIDEQQV